MLLVVLSLPPPLLSLPMYLDIYSIRLVFDSDFSLIEHVIGGHGHEGEWRVLLNLLGLLLGFAILAKYFEESNVPE